MDHVFPRTLFRKKDANMVTVQACLPCHDEKSLTEGDLRDFVSVDIGGAGHPDALHHLMTVGRATASNQSRVGQIVNSRAVETAWTTDAGIYLGEAIAIPTDDFREPVLQAVRWVVRGLYFYEVGQRLPTDCPVEVQHIPSDKASAVAANLAKLPPTTTGSRGNRVAEWASWRPQDAPHSTHWFLCFRGGVCFSGWTGALAEARRNFMKTGRWELPEITPAEETESYSSL